MEGLFIFPGLIDTGKGVKGALFPLEGRSSPESGSLGIDFGKLLEASVKRTEEGFSGTTFYPVRNCGTCGNEDTNQNPNPNPNPCSFSSAPTLSCSSNVSSMTSFGCLPFFEHPSRVDLSQVRESIAQFLEDLEGINFTLDLGNKGVVKVEGVKNENGEFSFQIQGSKDALTELFTMLFGYLTTMSQDEANTQNCLQGGSFSCGRTSVSCGGESARAVSLSNVDPSCATPLENLTCGGESARAVSLSNVDPSCATPLENLTPLKEGAWEETMLFPVMEEEDVHEVPVLDIEVVGETDGKIVPEAEVVVQEPWEIESDSLEVFSDKSEEKSGMLKVETKSSNASDSLVSLSSEATIPKATIVPSQGEAISVSNLKDPAEVEKIFDSILRFASQEKGTKEVVVKLQPESLGSIVVHLREDSNRLQCLWEIADTQTRELIQKSLPLLEARLQEQGFTFENFWSGNYQEQAGWQNTLRWALPSLSDVLDEPERESGFTFDDYRVNLLA